MTATAKRTRISAGTVAIHIFFILLSLSFILPLVMVFSVSITTQKELLVTGFKLIPLAPTWDSYKLIFKTPEMILDAYKVTAITSFASLFLYLLMASMCGYALSRKDFKWRSAISFFLFFTMMFSGGLVPYYLLVTQYLKLRNTIWVLIITQLGNVWHVFLMRTFFQDLPDSILESATIDGANEWQKYIRIVLPLAVPSLATIGLLNFIGYWNSWYNALLFIDEKSLRPLQYLLQVMLRNMMEMKKAIQQSAVAASYISTVDIPTEPLQMAMCIVAIGPVILVFPFFQKYLVKGLTVGSVKG